MTEQEQIEWEKELKLLLAEADIWRKMTDEEWIVYMNTQIANSPFATPQVKKMIEKCKRDGGEIDLLMKSLKYHSNWEWLMPIWENIDTNANYEHGYYSLKIEIF